MAVQLPPLSFPPLMPFIGSSSVGFGFGSQHYAAACSQPHFHPLQSFLPSHHFQMTNVGSTPRPQQQQQPLLPALHMVLPIPSSHQYHHQQQPHQPHPVERFAMPAPAPVRAMAYGSHSLPTSPVCSPPPSPSTEERRMKRKRAMSVPPTGPQKSLMARASASSASTSPQRSSSSTPSPSAAEIQSEVTFENGSQVAKWKLNGPRYKRCKVTGANGDAEWKRCQHCNTDSTPEWRTGPLGKGTLCNACGLRYRSKQREQSARGQGGNVPVSLLLNPTTTRKGRTNISNPLVWETKLSSFPVKADSPQQPHVC